MAVAGEDFLNVAGHGHATHAFGVVPVKFCAGKFGALPVLSDFVVPLKDVTEVKGVDFSYVFNDKVIINEGEYKSLPLVNPESRCCGILLVAVFVEACGKEIVGELASLGEAIDTFANFEIDPSVAGFV